MGLDMAVLYWRNFINIFNDFVGFFKALLDIAAGGTIDAVNVAAGAFVDMLFLNNRRAGLGRFENVGGCRQFFIIRFDQRHRFLGDLPAVGGHRGNDVADAAHFVDDQHRLIFDTGAEIWIQSDQVVACHHGAHTAQRRGFAGIDAQKFRMGIGAAQRLGVELASEFHIGNIAHRAADLGAAADHFNVGADKGHDLFSVLPLARVCSARRVNTPTRWRL